MLSASLLDSAEGPVPGLLGTDFFAGKEKNVLLSSLIKQLKS